MLKGKTIVLGVTGSIAAYKIANLASMLVKLHGDVHVIMTENATKFWITKDGIELEHNNSQIPSKDLKKINRYILSNRSDIIASWYSHFGF